MNQGYYDHQEKVCHEVLRSWHPEARRLLEIMALKSKFQKTSMMMRSRRPIILVVTSVTMTETGARPLVISRQCSRPGHRWRRSALQLSVTRKFSLPTGGFFLALADGQGPSGPKMTLPDGRRDRRTNGRTDNGFKGVRCIDIVKHSKLNSFPYQLKPARLLNCNSN